MAAEIAHGLAARHRVANEREVRKIEVIDERGDIVGESVEVVAAGRLIGAAMAAAVIADDAVVLGPGVELVVPHMEVGAERVRQHQGGRAVRSGYLDMDRAAVVGIDHWHESPPRQV